MAEAVNNTPPVSLRPLTEADLPAWQAVYEATPGYFRLMTRRPPSPQQAAADFAAAREMPGRIQWGIFIPGAEGPELVGVVDLRLAEDNLARIGLLLVAEPHQRRGIGSQAYRLIERWLRDQMHVRTIEISVAAANVGAQRFFQKHGYAFTGGNLRVPAGEHTVRLLAMRKELDVPSE